MTKDLKTDQEAGSRNEGCERRQFMTKSRIENMNAGRM